MPQAEHNEQENWAGPAKQVYQDGRAEQQYQAEAVHTKQQYQAEADDERTHDAQQYQAEAAHAKQQMQAEAVRACAAP